MDKSLENIKTEYLQKISEVISGQDLEKVRIEIFGRNGIINDLFSKIKDISNENKKQYGSDLNQLKTELENQLESKKQTAQKTELKIPFFHLKKWVIFILLLKPNEN